MEELMIINKDGDKEQLVSGRELHKFLEVKSKYNDWFLRMCEYGFSENEDYEALTQKKVTAQGNNTSYINHILKLDMAKEISMFLKRFISKW